jgi:tripartite ATP-independent transporter DctM subunit
MEALQAGALTLLLIVFFLGAGIWVFSGLLLVGIAALVLVLGYPLDRVGNILKGIMWRSASSWELSAIPLFVLMGEIIFRTDLSERIFRGLSPWLNWLPGRLLHTNIAGCTIFAAVSGSSAATTATIGKITAGALLERGYDSDLAIGSLAGAGSLGLLIPPSIVMIIYGILAEVSIARLFAAGILPGLMVAALYSGYIMLRGLLNPRLAPQAAVRFTLADRLRGLLDLLPVGFLVVAVLGGIYSGIATPSEAAALGCGATALITLAMRQLRWSVLRDALMSTVVTSSMIVSIVVCAAFLSSAMGYIHLPQDLAAAIADLELGPFGLMLILALFYIVLGLFLDGFSITVMSLPITLPLVVQAGWDPLWFGVFLVIMVELAQITPPIGFNLFVLQGLTGWSIYRIARAALPFFLLLCLAAALLTLLPQIALWLPGQLWQGR